MKQSFYALIYELGTGFFTRLRCATKLKLYYFFKTQRRFATPYGTVTTGGRQEQGKACGAAEVILNNHPFYTGGVLGDHFITL